MYICTRREQPPEVFWHCPTGYSCQFGGWTGTTNLISRNDKPQQPSTGNAVGALLKPGKTYRLWFQRVGDEVSIHVNGRPVFVTTEAVPMAGEGLDRLAIRSWVDVDVLSMSVWRMGSPQKTSPLAIGDAFVRRHRFADAVAEYGRVWHDQKGTVLAEKALLRTYVVAGVAPAGMDSLRAVVRRTMQQDHGRSGSWARLLEADCREAWRARRFDDALTLAGEALALDRHSRIALQMLYAPPDSLTQPAVDGLMKLVGRTTRVTGLTLRGLGLRDLEPLRGMRLITLDCNENQLASLEPLRGMPLRRLCCRVNRIASLAPLTGMPLEDLQIDGNGVEDLGPLAGLPIRRFTLADNRVSDLTPLAGCRDLAVLQLSNNRVASLEPLRRLPLQDLRCDRNLVTDLAPVAGLPLGHLDCGMNRIRDLQGVAGLPLKDLLFSGNPISDLTPLRGMSLEILEFFNCAVEDLSPLAGMRLRELDASMNRVTSLEPLAGMPLVRLIVLANRIESLAPLAGMPLEILHCDSNLIQDLRPLAGMPLRLLYAAANPLQDLVPFERSVPPESYFDEPAEGPAYTARVLDQWQRHGDTLSVRLTRTRIAARKADVAALRRLATPFQGHSYLYVPGRATYNAAVAMAATTGGHLATETTAAEERLVRSLVPEAQGGWLGLEYDGKQWQWVTGEPWAWSGFYTTYYGLASGRAAYQVRHLGLERGWFAADRDTVTSSALIEWE